MDHVAKRGGLDEKNVGHRASGMHIPGLRNGRYNPAIAPRDENADIMGVGQVRSSSKDLLK
jgi:hypothetical protein